ncbi:MAG: HD-GYP domain-containing protein [Candidatus Omnitrophica bacterium]|nr:HD-GYP domain-containing protein [Candidatus Omnitrophota bacterium]
MKINYKKELESAAKTMILVHDPTTLIKMIARTIVNKARVHHAGILLHDKEKDSYILTVSRGTAGLKIPSGFARMDSDNPLISFFKKRFDKQVLDDGVFIYGEAKKIANKRKIDPQVKKVLKGALYQMEIFEAVVCIPSYYRDELLGLLLLGKKKSGKKFAQDELDFFVALASDVAMAIQNALLFKELTSELDKKQRLFIHTTIALAAAIDAKDHYTHGHTARVTRISLDIAKEISLRNNHRFDDKFLEDLHVASLLHDIGKIGIPESILNKNDKLTPEEICKIKQHPTVGTTIIQPIRELDRAILGVKYHHERFDGGGYPEGLKGEEIPIIAVIISAADAFDAMTSDRPYRKALTTKQAIDEIKQGKGKQFHPEVAEALISLHHKNQL